MSYDLSLSQFLQGALKNYTGNKGGSFSSEKSQAVNQLISIVNQGKRISLEVIIALAEVLKITDEKTFLGCKASNLNATVEKMLPLEKIGLSIFSELPQHLHQLLLKVWKEYIFTINKAIKEVLSIDEKLLVVNKDSASNDQEELKEVMKDFKLLMEDCELLMSLFGCYKTVHFTGGIEQWKQQAPTGAILFLATDEMNAQFEKAFWKQSPGTVIEVTDAPWLSDKKSCLQNPYGYRIKFNLQDCNAIHELMLKDGKQLFKDYKPVLPKDYKDLLYCEEVEKDLDDLLEKFSNLQDIYYTLKSVANKLEVEETVKLVLN